MRHRIDASSFVAAALLASLGAVGCKGASSPGRVEVARFEGYADPATGTLSFRMVPQASGERLASVLLPGDTTPGRGVGTPGTVELATEWVSYTDLAGVTIPGPHPCGKPGSFCALVTMRSYYATQEIHNLYADITALSPASHDGFAVQLDPGGLGLNGTYGLWAYPALLDSTRGAVGGTAPGGNAASVVWYFNNTDDSAFTFTGSIMGDLVDTTVVQPAGYDAICGGVATPLDTIANCGECGRTAPAGSTCSYVGNGSGSQGSANLVSTVTCADGAQTACLTAAPNAYACVDLQTDAANCGACGNPCSDGATCVAGVCTSTSCPAGTAENNGTCVVASATGIAVGSDMACLTASQAWLGSPGTFVAEPTFDTNVLCWGNSHISRMGSPAWSFAKTFPEYLEPGGTPPNHSFALSDDHYALTCGTAGCVSLSDNTATDNHPSAAFFFGDYWEFVHGVNTMATQLSLGASHGVAIYLDNGTQSNRVLSWGSTNAYGQIGYTGLREYGPPRDPEPRLTAPLTTACRPDDDTTEPACPGYPNLALPALGQVNQDGTAYLTASRVAAGGNTSCAVLQAPESSSGNGPGQTAGTVACWGQNDSGQATGVAGANVLMPAVVAGVSGATDVSVGLRHSVAYDGTSLFFWGDNSAGQFGGTQTGAITTIDPGRSVSSLSAGGDVTCFVSGGIVYCAGQNGSGQLGQGDTAQHAGFVAVPNIVNAVAVSAGTTISGTASTVCALTSGGLVYCWGDNSAGQLGIGAPGGHAETPVLVQMQPL